MVDKLCVNTDKTTEQCFRCLFFTVFSFIVEDATGCGVW